LARLGTTVVPSETFRRLLLGLHFPARRTAVVPNGVELRRREAAPRHTPFRIATAGRIERWKGLDLLLAACALVEEPMHVHVFGEGSLRPELEAWAIREGVTATFHGWVSDVADRLAEVDLFVLPTRADNLPLVVLEAMSSAVPVVATRVGGIPELVVNGATGILVDPEDIVELAAAIERLARDEPLRVRFGAAAAERVAERFEANVVARRMVALYEHLTQAA
jgi:colanic acid/amylovoran biosynthesis glycosyltransferase